MLVTSASIACRYKSGTQREIVRAFGGAQNIHFEMGGGGREPLAPLAFFGGVSSAL